MDIDTLYPRVTEAIRRAEALEDLKAPDARRAFAEVSRLEEQIASLLPQFEYEGVIARRGAVRAAIKAHEFGRARELATRFESEDGVDEALAADLAALKAQASTMADRENPLTAKSLRRAIVRDSSDASGNTKRRALASNLTPEAIVRALESATVAYGMDRKMAKKAAKRAVMELLGEPLPKPKKSA
jgi:hypothetical protein